jgi:cytoskeletal protein RodZ
LEYSRKSSSLVYLPLRPREYTHRLKYRANNERKQRLEHNEISAIILGTMTLPLQRQQLRLLPTLSSRHPYQSQGTSLAWRWVAFCAIYVVVNAWYLHAISIAYSDSQPLQQQLSANTKRNGHNPLASDSAADTDTTTTSSSSAASASVSSQIKAEPVALLNRQIVQDYFSIRCSTSTCNGVPSDSLHSIVSLGYIFVSAASRLY